MPIDETTLPQFNSLENLSEINSEINYDEVNIQFSKLDTKNENINQQDFENLKKLLTKGKVTKFTFSKIHTSEEKILQIFDCLKDCSLVKLTIAGLWIGQKPSERSSIPKKLNEVLKKCKTLTHLNLTKFPIIKQMWHSVVCTIGDLKSLQELTLDQNPGLGNFAVIDKNAPIEPPSIDTKNPLNINIPKTTKLISYRENISLNQRQLKKLPTTEKQHPNVQDFCIQHLADNLTVKKLSLVECDIHDWGCWYLSKIESIESINLACNPISPVGVSFLQKKSCEISSKFSIKNYNFIALDSALRNFDGSNTRYIELKFDSAAEKSLTTNNLYDSINSNDKIQAIHFQVSATFLNVFRGPRLPQWTVNSKLQSLSIQHSRYKRKSLSDKQFHENLIKSFQGAFESGFNRIILYRSRPLDCTIHKLEKTSDEKASLILDRTKVKGTGVKHILRAVQNVHFFYDKLKILRIHATMNSDDWGVTLTFIRNATALEEVVILTCLTDKKDGNPIVLECKQRNIQLKLVLKNERDVDPMDHANIILEDNLEPLDPHIYLEESDSNLARLLNGPLLLQHNSSEASIKVTDGKNIIIDAKEKREKILPEEEVNRICNKLIQGNIRELSLRNIHLSAATLIEILKSCERGHYKRRWTIGNQNFTTFIKLTLSNVILTDSMEDSTGVVDALLGVLSTRDWIRSLDLTNFPIPKTSWAKVIEKLKTLKRLSNVTLSEKSINEGDVALLKSNGVSVSIEKKQTNKDSSQINDIALEHTKEIEERLMELINAAKNQAEIRFGELEQVQSKLEEKLTKMDVTFNERTSEFFSTYYEKCKEEIKIGVDHRFKIRVKKLRDKLEEKGEGLDKTFTSVVDEAISKLDTLQRDVDRNTTFVIEALQKIEEQSLSIADLKEDIEALKLLAKEPAERKRIDTERAILLNKHGNFRKFHEAFIYEMERMYIGVMAATSGIFDKNAFIQSEAGKSLLKIMDLKNSATDLLVNNMLLEGLMACLGAAAAVTQVATGGVAAPLVILPAVIPLVKMFSSLAIKAVSSIETLVIGTIVGKVRDESFKASFKRLGKSSSELFNDVSQDMSVTLISLYEQQLINLTSKGARQFARTLASQYIKALTNGFKFKTSSKINDLMTLSGNESLETQYGYDGQRKSWDSYSRPSAPPALKGINLLRMRNYRSRGWTTNRIVNNSGVCFTSDSKTYHWSRDDFFSRKNLIKGSTLAKLPLKYSKKVRTEAWNIGYVTVKNIDEMLKLLRSRNHVMMDYSPRQLDLYIETWLTKPRSKNERNENNLNLKKLENSRFLITRNDGPVLALASSIVIEPQTTIFNAQRHPYEEMIGKILATDSIIASELCSKETDTQLRQYCMNEVNAFDAAGQHFFDLIIHEVRKANFFVDLLKKNLTNLQKMFAEADALGEVLDAINNNFNKEASVFVPIQIDRCWALIQVNIINNTKSLFEATIYSLKGVKIPTEIVTQVKEELLGRQVNVDEVKLQTIDADVSEILPVASGVIIAECIKAFLKGNDHVSTGNIKKAFEDQRDLVLRSYGEKNEDRSALAMDLGYQEELYNTPLGPPNVDQTKSAEVSAQLFGHILADTQGTHQVMGLLEHIQGVVATRLETEKMKEGLLLQTLSHRN